MRLFPCNLDTSTYPIVPVFSARRYYVRYIREHLIKYRKWLPRASDRNRFGLYGRPCLQGRWPCDLMSKAHRMLCFILNKVTLKLLIYIRHPSTFANRARESVEFAWELGHKWHWQLQTFWCAAAFSRGLEWLTSIEFVSRHSSGAGVFCKIRGAR